MRLSSAFTMPYSEEGYNLTPFDDYRLPKLKYYSFSQGRTSDRLLNKFNDGYMLENVDCSCRLGFDRIGLLDLPERYGSLCIS